MKKISALLLAFALLMTLFPGCGVASAAEPSVSPTAAPRAVPSITGTGSATLRRQLRTAEFGDLIYPKTYAELAEVLSDLTGYRDGYYGDMIMEEAEMDMPLGTSDSNAGKGENGAPPPMVAATTAPNAQQTPADDGKDFSGTNTQVEGVDEGDIVKTDGDYIYILRNEELIIILADGADTKEVSRTRLSEGGALDYSKYNYAREIYINGDRLAIVCDAYRVGNVGITYSYDYYRDGSGTIIDIYDIADRNAPKRIAEVGQDGYFTASRMIGDTLCLITNYNVWSVDEDDPETFVPALYRDGERELVSEGCLVICPPFNNTSYTVVTTYDINSGEAKSNQSVLGGGNNVYMNGSNLYVTRQEWSEEVGEPYQEDHYRVTKYSSAETTIITRFSFVGGKVSLISTGTVNGQLLNQFSLDEYNGYLRVVTTENDYSYTIYEDEKRGWSNYEYGDNESSNALYILNLDLITVSSITGLGRDERVYSVRFDGDVGYFVTFRQTDPLFTVDLADPFAPKVLSALKIPGFSQYLHVYGEGRLFGLGMDADPDTGWTNGMKLSMFDTSDKTNVTEKHMLKLDSTYSEALYNHKAILISPARDIIAFPTSNGYDVYGYSDDRGFYIRASIKGGEDWWGYNMRGLYIEDYAYICGTDGVSVFDMTDFTAVKSVTF